MADVILTQAQADDLSSVIEALTAWCPDENFESAMGDLTNSCGIEEPVDRITELCALLDAQTQTL